MPTILTILTFPVPAMALWNLGDLEKKIPEKEDFSRETNKNFLEIVPLAFTVHHGEKPACERILPQMWESLMGHHDSIAQVATLGEPGPFTALRAGLSFAQGLAHGDKEWSFYTTSLFALLPEDVRQEALLDTGAHHWVNALGTMGKDTTSDHMISAKTCTQGEILSWSRQLAIYAWENCEK